jgi:1,3-beta-glucanosyltransferase GAS3
MNDYISKNSNRTIPVGYSAADVRPMLVDTAYYLSCNLTNATDSRSAFFGLNSYSWCGDATYESSTYDVLTDDFKNVSIPVFFSETGCNAVKPRTFTEMESIYSTNMTDAISGALVYEWTQEANDYGLVSINDNGTITLLTDFENLKAQYDKIDFSAITASNSTQNSVEAPICNPDSITSNITTDWDIPARVAGIDQMITDGYTTNVSVGALVSVSSTNLTQTIYDPSGNIVTGIMLNVLANGTVNTPGGNATTTTVSSSGSSGTASSTSSSASSSTTTGAAISNRAGAISGLGALIATAFLAL